MFGDERARPTEIIRSSQRDIIMPDLACDLFENAIWLSRFIEFEKFPRRSRETFQCHRQT
jgi:hypothetical protein